MNRRAKVVRVNHHHNRRLRRLPRPLSHLLLLPLHPAEKKKRKTFSSMADLKHHYSAAVVTVSDSCSRGQREDRSGPAVSQLLEQLQFSVVAREVVPDDRIRIQNLLIRLAREARLVVTTGGTGIAST